MRIHKRVKQVPASGAERTIRKFCWWPAWSGQHFCWLETVTLEQFYVVTSKGGRWCTRHEVAAPELSHGALRSRDRYCWLRYTFNGEWYWRVWINHRQRYVIPDSAFELRHWVTDGVSIKRWGTR